MPIYLVRNDEESTWGIAFSEQIGLAVSANDHKITYWDLNVRSSIEHDEEIQKDFIDDIHQDSTVVDPRKIQFSGHTHNVPSIGKS